MPDVAPTRSQAETQPAGHSSDLISLLSQKIVGQLTATKAIVPCVYLYQSGLAPEGRPAACDDLNLMRHSQRRQAAVN